MINTERNASRPRLSLISFPISKVELDIENQLIFRFLSNDLVTKKMSFFLFYTELQMGNEAISTCFPIKKSSS